MARAPERPPFFSRRRVRVGLGISIAVLLLGAGGVLYALSAGTHPLTVSNAIDRFRQGRSTTTATPSATPAARKTTGVTPGATTGPRSSVGRTSKSGASKTASHEWVPEGVYVYATDGGDETDAVSGAHHDYPSRTTITVSRDGCGLVSRWQPVSERWDESEACQTTRGVALRRYSMYHEFFHRGVREDFACGSDAIVMPWKQVAGDRWSFHCSSAGSTLDMAVRVVGFETMRVGDRSVRAVHIRYDGVVHGADEGTQVQDRWLSVDDGLFLRITSSSNVETSSPFGRVHYEEQYAIDLTSTTPER